MRIDIFARYIIRGNFIKKKWRVHNFDTVYVRSMNNDDTLNVTTEK